ncbi:MAG: hypothetical protein IKI23_07475 [Lachnospiraceae bacterium]|nr:hypothetical protein [Lachnospiraceae bacterium]
MSLRNRNQYSEGTEGKPGIGGDGLRHLGRESLLELIVEQRKRIEELESQLAEARGLLRKRSLRLDIEKIGRKEDLALALRAVLEEVEDILENE